MNETQRPTENEPFEKQRISMAVLGVILVCGTISALLWLGRGNLTTFRSPSATITPNVTTTFTPTSSPTAIPTRTLRLTPTATPVPTWVAGFSEPILAAIANTPPHFEDDFSQESEGWRFDIGNNSRCRVKIKDGAFRMSVESGREAAWCSNPGMQMDDFALRVDIDFSGLGSADSAQIGWRGISYSSVLALSLFIDGSWSMYSCDNNPCTYLDSGRQMISPTQKVTITIISQDTEYAIYINEIPVSYINDIERRQGRVIKLGLEVPSKSSNPIIAYDNLKIWNLNYIPDLR